MWIKVDAIDFLKHQILLKMTCSWIMAEAEQRSRLLNFIRIGLLKEKSPRNVNWRVYRKDNFRVQGKARWSQCRNTKTGKKIVQKLELSPENKY